MPSEANAPIEEQPSPVPNLDSYRTRDEFVRAYQPTTEEQRLLVTQIARAWGHLQEMYELRSQITAEKSLFALFNDDFVKYQFLMRHLAEAERMWRHAVQEFQRARRRVEQEQPASQSKVRTSVNPSQTTNAAMVARIPRSASAGAPGAFPEPEH